MKDELQFQEVNPQFMGVLKRLEELNQKCTDNMNRLNQMMLELKGIVAMVRPQVKKTGWYGDELSTHSKSIDDTAINPPNQRMDQIKLITLESNFPK